ncbi:hypothetical protein SAMN05216464_106284 [Mucilaginibacter pineti]|uniref:Uncharacterized protein n=1 Tax=Mucilaginibacter pineti TaxID=1391627 RepID=A0A1G7D8U3_9SPHI|nr:hypothetical protein SAMN05216464_106284 [Mucilaginibacter pineti]
MPKHHFSASECAIDTNCVMKETYSAEIAR